jgi:hypothetical protein
MAVFQIGPKALVKLQKIGTQTGNGIIDVDMVRGAQTVKVSDLANSVKLQTRAPQQPRKPQFHHRIHMLSTTMNHDGGGGQKESD